MHGSGALFTVQLVQSSLRSILRSDCQQPYYAFDLLGTTPALLRTTSTRCSDHNSKSIYQHLLHNPSFQRVRPMAQKKTAPIASGSLLYA
jgi:hypothetical protein